MVKTSYDKFGDEVKERLALDAYVLGSDTYESWFLQAARVRRLVQKEWEYQFRKYDLIAMPTTLERPPTLKEAQEASTDACTTDIYTVMPSLCGLPTMNIPTTMPIQLVGPYLYDQMVLDYSQNETFRESPERPDRH